MCLVCPLHLSFTRRVDERKIKKLYYKIRVINKDDIMIFTVFIAGIPSR